MTDLDTIESIDLYEYCGGLYSATSRADGWVHNMLAETDCTELDDETETGETDNG